MTLNTAFKDSILLDFQDIENNKSIDDASLIIRNGLVNFFSAMKEEQNYTKDYEEMLDLTEVSIKKYANSQYKFATSLEPSEIELIKKSLSNYVNSNEKADSFKKEMLEDLTEFQKQILTNHKQKIVDFAKEKQTYEKQILILECAKNKLIMDRLSKIVWPYDAKTKEYDQKIAQLQAKLQQYTSKIENLKAMRPAANERDILLYKLHLKEKFTNKK